MAGSHPVIRLGSFEIHLETGDIRLGGETNRLQPQALALLRVLIEEPGRVVTREELRQRLWPDTSVEFEDGLNHAVARLREALHDSAHAPKFIETVPRKGYQFVGTVETVGLEPAPVPALQAMSSTPRGTSRRLAWTAAGLLAVVLAAGLAWRSSARGRSALGIRSIAVLPLADLSPDRAQDYFADGITEELITELARSESLRVLSRTSTLRYRGSTKSVPEIAGELGVDSLVEGSIQRVGDRVRVAAQLVRASPEEHVWAQSYEGRVEDVFAIRKRVAQDIVLKVGLSLPLASTHVHEPTPAAHEAFLIGWSFTLQETADGYAKSIGYFERATSLDPRYALAYAEMAESHAMLDWLDDRRGEHVERARELARKALELEPDLPEGRLREADLRFYWDWEWGQCETGFRQARDLSPGSSDAREHYALCLFQLGRDAEALREIERTLDVEPLSGRAHLVRAELLLGAGRAPEAIEAYRRAVDLNGGNASRRRRLATVLLDASRGGEALDALAAASRASGESPDWIAALDLAWRSGGPTALAEEARSQERRRLQRKLSDLEARARTERVSPVLLASVHAGLGELDVAFDLLEKGFLERCPRLGRIKSSPEWEPLRRDARYGALLRRMKLPEG